MSCFRRQSSALPPYICANSRRAGDMRTYAGDSVLPGGKYEDGDKDAEGTAVCLTALKSTEGLIPAARGLGRGGLMTFIRP